MNELENLVSLTGFDENGVFSSKKSGKGKRPGKGGNRFWKNIGLGFKTPREAIEGPPRSLFSYLDSFYCKCLD